MTEDCLWRSFTWVRIIVRALVVAVQSLSYITLCDPMDFRSLDFPVLCSHSCTLSQWCCLKISPSVPLLPLPSIFPSIRVFSNESVLHIRCPKYWSFSFSISLPNEYSVLIFFRIDWFDLPVVQGTLKSLLQNHSSKTSILQHSTFFMVLLSHPYRIYTPNN